MSVRNIEYTIYHQSTHITLDENAIVIDLHKITYISKYKN